MPKLADSEIARFRIAPPPNRFDGNACAPSSPHPPAFRSTRTSDSMNSVPTSTATSNSSTPSSKAPNRYVSKTANSSSRRSQPRSSRPAPKNSKTSSTGSCLTSTSSIWSSRSTLGPISVPRSPTSTTPPPAPRTTPNGSWLASSRTAATSESTQWRVSPASATTNSPGPTPGICERKPSEPPTIASSTIRPRSRLPRSGALGPCRRRMGNDSRSPSRRHAPGTNASTSPTPAPPSTRGHLIGTPNTARASSDDRSRSHVRPRCHLRQ